MSESNWQGMPRQEDVAEIDAGAIRLSVVTITDKNRSYLAEVALSMYTNEPCRICGEILTMKDIKNGAVFAGYSRDNAARGAHKACWDKYPSDKTGTPPSEWVHQ